MKKLGQLTFALSLVSLGCGDDSSTAETSADTQAVTGSEPRPSPMEALLEAIGGQGSLDGIRGVRLEGSGKRYLLNSGTRPEDEPIEANSFERSVSIDFSGTSLRVDTSRQIVYLFPGSQTYSETIQGNYGVSTQPLFGRPLGALGSDRVASIRSQELLLTPHLLLRTLPPAAFAAGPDVTIDGAPQHTLVASVGPRPLTLFVDASSGFITKLETGTLGYLERDMSLEVFFSDWAPAGDTSFPRNARVLVGGREVFSQQLSDVSVNPAFEAGMFELPEGVTPLYDEALYARGQLSQQWFAMFDSVGTPSSGVDVLVTRVDVAPNVAKLVGTTHHSFVVRQEAGLILADAALYEERGGALLDYLEAEYPGVPVTHVVASHFHEDHAAGIREVLGRTQAKLVVQESVAEFWRKLLTAPSTLRPDALAESPRNVDVITVPDAGEITLEDASNPVTIYHLNTLHAADMLLTRDVASNSVFVVDIYNPGNVAQPDSAALDEAITSHQIPTADLKLVGAHSAGIDDYAALKASLMPQ